MPRLLLFINTAMKCHTVLLMVIAVNLKLKVCVLPLEGVKSVSLGYCIWCHNNGTTLLCCGSHKTKQWSYFFQKFYFSILLPNFTAICKQCKIWTLEIFNCSKSSIGCASLFWERIEFFCVALSIF